ETSTAIDPVTRTSYFGLQQVRWSPTNIADTPEEALARMFQVFEDGKEFAASLTGAEDNPPVATDQPASFEAGLEADGSMHFELRAETDLHHITQAHSHWGARGQNGPIVAFLLPFNPAGRDFAAGDVMAEGTLTDANLIARPGFTPTIANLVE